MAEVVPLVPKGALILREDLTEVGQVTRSTATSAWVGELRLVKGGWGADLRSVGLARNADYVIADSERHKHLIEHRARQVRQAEAGEVYRARIALQKLVDQMVDRLDNESHEQHMARLKHAADVLRAALEGEHV